MCNFKGICCPSTVALFRQSYFNRISPTVHGKKIPPRGFLAITRHHGDLQVPGRAEFDPVSLPELPKPSRTQGKLQKPMFLDSTFLQKKFGNKSLESL